jgi:uncharacterized protein YbjT (DUF2867 family)
MKLVVIGATSRTGRLVIDRATAAGHHLTAVARNPAAVTVTHPELTVVRGDVEEPDSLVEPVAGADAVFYLVAKPGRTTYVTRSTGAANLAKAMDIGGSRRVFTVSPTAIDVPPQASPVRKAWVKFFLDKRNRNPFLEFDRTEDELRHSGLDWTVIRVRSLSDGPATGDYRTAAGRYIDKERPLSRADLADFLIDQAGDLSTSRSIVTVSGPV